MGRGQILKRAAALVAALAIAGAVAQPNQVPLDRDSPFVQGILRSLVPEDTGDVLVLAEIFAIARDLDKAERLEAFAERRVLQRVLRDSRDTGPRTVAVAIATTRSRVHNAELRSRVRDTPITFNPPGSPSSASTASIRNDAGLSIAALQLRLSAVYGSNTFTCQFAPGQPPIAPDAVGPLTCRPDEANAGPDAFARELDNRRGTGLKLPPLQVLEVRFAPDNYYLVTGGQGTFPSRRDEAIERVRRASPAERPAEKRRSFMRARMWQRKT